MKKKIIGTILPLLSTNMVLGAETVSSISLQKAIPPIVKDLSISKIGYGAEQLSFPEMDIETAQVLLTKALNLGCTLFVTAAAYGRDSHNERLLGEILENKKDAVIITKGGIDYERGEYTQSPEDIITSVEKSLINLKRSTLDIFILHRINPNATPGEFEKTISTLKDLVIKGKIKYVGLSEPTKEQLLKAMAVEPKTVPISVVESAYSLFTRRAEVNGVLKACLDHRILFVSYTSVLRGLADSRLKGITQFEVSSLSILKLKEKVFGLLNLDPYRQTLGWFDDLYIRGNLLCALNLIHEAEKLGKTPAQLALAYSIGKGVIPIPATTKENHLEENMLTLKNCLSKDQMQKLEELLPQGVFKGIPNSNLYTTFNNDDALEEIKS